MLIQSRKWTLAIFSAIFFINPLFAFGPVTGGGDGDGKIDGGVITGGEPGDGGKVGGAGGNGGPNMPVGTPPSPQGVCDPGAKITLRGAGLNTLSESDYTANLNTYDPTGKVCSDVGVPTLGSGLHITFNNKVAKFTRMDGKYHVSGILTLKVKHIPSGMVRTYTLHVTGEQPISEGPIVKLNDVYIDN